MASSERFGYEWDTYQELLPQYEEQFLKWVYPLTKNFFRSKTVLDAGCGMGRNSYWPLQYGAAQVTAFDLDERSLSAARNLLKPFENVEVLSGDIKHFDTDKRFDIAFSIGVIHHLRHPDVAVRNMARLLKPGGTLLIWVYGYEGNEWIVRFINPIRKRCTSRLPLPIVHALTYFASVPLYLYVRFGSPRFAYLRQIKKFSFKHLHSIVFDQLIPEVANYWTRDEAESLLKHIPDLIDVQSFPVNGMSWTVCGIRR